MSDKVDAARVAWATVKLSQVGQQPVRLDDVAARVGLPAGEALRLLKLTWRDQVAIRDGMIELDMTAAGPRRYQVRAGDRQAGSGKGCSVDMYLLALALGRAIHAEAICPVTGTPITVDISPERVERIDPPTAVVAVLSLEVDLTFGPERTDADVCAQQPFFTSPQAGARWLAEHPQGRLIPVRDFHTEAIRLVDWLEASPATPHDIDSRTQEITSRPRLVQATLADVTNTDGPAPPPSGIADPMMPDPGGPVDPTLTPQPVPEVGRPAWFTLMAPGWMPPANKVTQALGICFTADNLVVMVTWDGQRWTFPGGTVEPGETVRQALIREVAEEACATVTARHYLSCQHVADPETPTAPPATTRPAGGQGSPSTRGSRNTR